MKATLFQKLAIAVVVGTIGFMALSHFNLIPGAIKQEAAVPQAFDLPTAEVSQPTAAVERVSLPSTKPAMSHGQTITIAGWEWNAQMGLHFANGGPITTAGSLMDKNNVTVRIVRKDITDESKAAQLKLAEALSNGGSVTDNMVHFVVIMGDQAGQYLASFNQIAKKIGADFYAEVVGAVGYSRGEDAWWGPQEWKDDPQTMKGGVTIGVLREGDWNIVQYKLANDGIKNNPDETTYDPDAMNWIATDDYIKAAQLYVSGKCENRKVVRNGKLTGEMHNTCGQAVTTWTPGDVLLAKGKGGLVRLLSTAENVFQMPAVLVGIHQWDVTHAKQVESILTAALVGGDQVRTFPEALTRAGQASYAIYADQSPAYWVKYYRGVVERDKTQQPVQLGGSTTMNLADNMLLFGLSEGAGGLGGSLFNASYTGFARIVSQQYPRLLPSFPTTEEAVNTQFIKAISSRLSTQVAEVEKFEESGPVQKENIVGTRNWNIQFETGKADFTPDAEASLKALYDQLLIGGALSAEIDGHTDNVGNKDSNQTLSEQRASKVKGWMEEHAGSLFPANRISVRGFGDTSPIAPNSTPDGRAKNRRVTVILATKG